MESSNGEYYYRSSIMLSLGLTVGHSSLLLPILISVFEYQNWMNVHLSSGCLVQDCWASEISPEHVMTSELRGATTAFLSSRSVNFGNFLLSLSKICTELLYDHTKPMAPTSICTEPNSFWFSLMYVVTSLPWAVFPTPSNQKLLMGGVAT